MKNKIILCFSLLAIVPIPGFSQDDRGIEALMTRRVPTCFEIAINCFTLIPSYYNQGKLDSATLILNYWIRNCPSEISFRTRIIFALKEGTFSEDSLDRHFVYWLAKPVQMARFTWLPPTPVENEFDAGLDSYETFLRTISAEALSGYKPGTVGYLLSRHFAGRTDSTLSDLQTADYCGTKLQHDYYDAVESIKNSYSEVYIGIGIGTWIPVSKELSKFGPRPEISLTLFNNICGYNTQLYGAFRFGPSKSPYSFTYKGVPYSTNQFTGFSLGIETLPRLAISRHDDLGLIAGIMIDGYSPPKSAGNPDDKGANSLNATFGLKYGYKLSPWGAPVVVLEMRVNPYIASTSGFDSAPLGTSATIRLSVFFGKDHRAELLNRLSYTEE